MQRQVVSCGQQNSCPSAVTGQTEPEKTPLPQYPRHIAEIGGSTRPELRYWASEQEQEAFLAGETAPELRDYLSAGFSESAAREALTAGIPPHILMYLLCHADDDRKSEKASCIWDMEEPE